MNTISRPRLTELLTYDPATGYFTRLTDNRRGCRIGDRAGSVNGDGYRFVYVDGRNYAEHRLAWFYTHGHWPLYDIDHINGDKADNRIANLRDAPTCINMQNTRRPQKSNRSGFMGVHWRKDRKRWVAQIRVNGKAIRLGSFKTPEEAESAYIAGKRMFHPGFTI